MLFLIIISSIFIILSIEILKVFKYFLNKLKINEKIKLGIMTTISTIYLYIIYFYRNYIFNYIFENFIFKTISEIILEIIIKFILPFFGFSIVYLHINFLIKEFTKFLNKKISVN